MIKACIRSLASVWRGLRAMRRSEILRRWSARWQLGFWVRGWTPIWHKGRGPYISLGCGLFAIYHGY